MSKQQEFTIGYWEAIRAKGRDGGGGGGPESSKFVENPQRQAGAISVSTLVMRRGMALRLDVRSSFFFFLAKKIN